MQTTSGRSLQTPRDSNKTGSKTDKRIPTASRHLGTSVYLGRRGEEGEEERIMRMSCTPSNADNDLITSYTIPAQPTLVAAVVVIPEKNIGLEGRLSDICSIYTVVGFGAIIQAIQ
ncbi:hypothetical protein CHS0354_008698 [Potamilus streckersoni]|uniref:Uncharacterized protein n=1 Tax=Potamilus streckersoni TaxID=2493646 RepID=A0AAE0WCM3_9BIVA|nr:hypothetical protein CHS0354_008698 [Potamilus streckersoni]